MLIILYKFLYSLILYMNTSNKCKYAILLYAILIILLFLIKPNCCYYDNNKTKLKEWNLFIDTKNYYDIITLPFIIILISILSYVIVYLKY